ncbi:TSUP family transporter [Candidatus Puniceispirillum sp.]|nr:TSUP family transporter [Candidatus Puniceispirillum sp.]
MLDPQLIIMVAVTFCFAGVIKGMVGLGLPTVSIGLLTLIVDLPTAMALLLVPSLTTNIWQALVGGNFFYLLRRLGLFFLMAVVMVHVGAQLFIIFKIASLLRVLGALLLLYALLGLIGKSPELTLRQQTVFGPVCGAINGLLTGLTGTLFVPGVMFLQAIGLPQNVLVQAMGMLFAALTASLGLALYQHDLLSPNVGAMSAAALAPALIGMWFGQMLRNHMSQDLFRRLFLIALGGLGSYILAT